MVFMSKIKISMRNLYFVCSYFCILSLFSCQELSSILSGEEGVGVVTGYVIAKDNLPLEDVEVAVSVAGEVKSVFSDKQGKFRLIVPNAKRNEGYNITFEKNNFSIMNKAIVFETPNLRVDLDRMLLKVVGSEKAEVRYIQGIIQDDFSETGLANATVYVQNALNVSVVANTDYRGYFILESPFFVEGSSYTVSITKENYVARSNMLVNIVGIRNYINNKLPIRLYKKYGSIKGKIVDNDGNAISGANIKISDSLNIAKTAVSNANGIFTVTSENFYLGNVYPIEVVVLNYQTQKTAIEVSTTGENDAGLIYLIPNCFIRGIVKDSSNNPLAGVTVTVSNFSYDNLSTTTNSSGIYELVHTKLARNESYQLTFAKANYGVQKNQVVPPLVIGSNNFNISLQSAPVSSTGITGVIRSYYFNEEIENVNVYVIDENNNYRFDRTDNRGIFTINGNFINNKIYTLTFEKPTFYVNGVPNGIQYTGDGLSNNVYESSFQFTFLGNVGSTYDLTTSYQADLKLYPIGIFIKDSESDIVRKNFIYDIKQTFEEFLNDKVGLTIAARDNHINRQIKDHAGSSDDGSSFYIHIVNPDYPISEMNAGYAYTTIPVNGAPVRVVQYERLETDTRTVPYGIKNYSLLRFFISNPSFVSITTSGIEVDTYMSLYRGNSLIAEDDNSGELWNASIRRNLPKGWYIIKVKPLNDLAYGNYYVNVTADLPQTSFFNTIPLSLNTSDTEGNVVLSYYKKKSLNDSSQLYIAGVGEIGSSSHIVLEKFGARNSIIRGSFYGNLISVSKEKRIFPVGSESQNQGFFNIIRQE